MEPPIAIDVGKYSPLRLACPDVERAREWTALILACAISNALDHSRRYPDISPLTLRLDVHGLPDKPLLCFRLDNTCRSLRDRERFLKHTADVPSKGTFFVLHEYGKKLFRTLGFGDRYSFDGFLAGIDAGPRRVALNISIPLPLGATGPGGRE